MSSEERIAELEALVAQQAEQIAVLLARVHELEARLAKDSHNSSKPPSSDGLKRKTKSLRAKSGKKPGGQVGHRGETLRLVAVPDAVVEQRPTRCAECQTPLAQADVVPRERRQVYDLPPVMRLVVEEQQALHLRCPKCAHISIGAFPAAAPSRAQYGPRLRALSVYLVEEQHMPLGRAQRLVADLFGAQLGRGTLVSWVQQAARVLEPVEQGLRHLADTERMDLLECYHALLVAGLAANPPPPNQPRALRQRGRRAESPTRNLLGRLLLNQDQVLAFLDDLAIPFDNNQAESATCAGSRSNKRFPAASAATGEQRRTRQSAAIWRRYASKAGCCSPPWRPSSPVSPWRLRSTGQ